jgi:hypothetical protein
LQQKKRKEKKRGCNLQDEIVVKISTMGETKQASKLNKKINLVNLQNMFMSPYKKTNYCTLSHFVGLLTKMSQGVF